MLTAFAMGDRDFCGPSHRRNYHERLRHILQQVADPPLHCVSQAGFKATDGAGFATRDLPSHTCPIRWLIPDRVYPPLRPALALAADAGDLLSLAPPPQEPAEILEPAPTPPPAVMPRRDTGADTRERLNRIHWDLLQKRLGAEARLAHSAAIG